MVGRSLDALFPKEEAEIGETSCFRAEGLTRARRLLRRLVRAAARRDRRPRGLRRRRPDRGRALRSSGSTRSTTGRSGSRAGRSGRARRAPRCAAGSRTCPRTAAAGAHPADVDRAELDDGRPAGAHAGRASCGRGASGALTRTFMEQLRIKATSPAQVVRSLSGGNQQKVVLSKWLAVEPRILILDEPTHGVDVGTKADVHRTISHLAAQGLDDPADLVGAAGDPRHGRPRARDARGPARRRALARGGDAGAIVAGGGGGRGGMITHCAAVSPQDARARRRSACASSASSSCSESRSSSSRSARTNFLTVSNWQDIATDVAIVVVRRGRPDDGRADAQHRPQRRLDRRPDAPTCPRTTLASHHGAADRAGRADRDRDRARARDRQRPARRGRRGSRRSSPRSRRSRSTAASRSRSRTGRTSRRTSCRTRFLDLAARKPLGLPMLAWFAVVVALAGAAVLRWAPWGRDFYAIGSNPDAARFAGIPAGRRVILAFTISGALAGLGGFMWAVALRQRRRRRRRRTSSSTSITAVVIGGVNVFGGSGTDARRRARRGARRDDPGRLHAAAAVGVLEDVLQRRRRSSSRSRSTRS